jgi:alpha-N-arabinofuranosidase
MKAGGNSYYDGARPYQGEESPSIVGSSPNFKIIEEGDHVYLEGEFSPKRSTARIVTTETLGKALVPDLPYLDFDGSPVELDTDYFGKPRDPENTTPGPFSRASLTNGRIRVW